MKRKVHQKCIKHNRTHIGDGWPSCYYKKRKVHTWKQTRKRLIKKHGITQAEIAKAKRKVHRHRYDRCGCIGRPLFVWCHQPGFRYCSCGKRKP